MNRTIIIGDIHGCFEELQDLLGKINPAPQDRVISVGDLIVKGERSREVLDLFINDKRFFSVLGNHDRALLRYWNGDLPSLKKAQEKTRLELEPDRERYCAYLRSLPLTIDLGTHVVIHAGFRPGVEMSAQSAGDLTEIRTLGPDRTSRVGVPWYEVYGDEKIVLFGHWPADNPRRGRRAIGLDTGCVYGNRLTSYVIETNEFFSVEARRVYDPPSTLMPSNRGVTIL